ncbi:MAG: glycosyltransferase family 4 protein [Streptosporangiaceae bacterium]
MAVLGSFTEPDARGSFRLLIVSAEALAEGHGSATALVTFIQAAVARRDWHLTIVAPDGPDPHGAFPSGRVRYLRLPNGRWPGRRWQLLRFVVQAISVCARLGRSSPDLIISWQPIPAGLAGAISARIAHCPHVVRTCGPELTFKWGRFPLMAAALRPVTAVILRKADAVVVKSEIELRLVGADAADRAFLIPNAVPSPFFATVPGPPIGDSPFVRLLTVCQLEPHKGVRQLLRALAIGHAAKDCELTVVGDGSQRAMLERMASVIGIRARFLGRIPNHLLPAVYAEHHAFVLASAMEACSNAVLEAMACGLPVIGSSSALSDLVEDGVTGVLAEGADEHEISHAITRFLAMRARISAMQEAVRLTAARHSSVSLIEAYDEMFRRLLPTDRS